MTKQDRRAQLVAKFKDLSMGRIARLHSSLSALEEDPDNEQVRAEAMREIHTVKGEARIMGFDLINAVAHKTEDLMVSAQERGFRIRAEDWVEMVSGLDIIGALAEDPIDPHQGLVDASHEFIKKRPGPAAAEAKDTEKEHPAEAPEEVVESATAAPTPEKKESASKTNGNQEPARAGNSGAGDFVHVDGESLTTLTSLSGDLVVHHDQLERLLGDVTRIVEELSRTIEADGLDQGQKDARLQALAREMRTTVAKTRDETFDTHLDLKTLQDRIQELRLLRVEGLLEAHARGARNLARELNKPVRIKTRGGDVVADKQIIDFLQDPVLHLVRNAVDHGIEPRDVRAKAGKPENGTIMLEAQEHGGHIEVIISDDGGGIDIEKVRSRATERALVDHKTADGMSDEEILKFIFHSGFSTQEVVSDVSGRGVGLDVVQDRLDALGGEVRIDSVPGRGTKFILRAPISVAIAKALVVRCAGGYFAIPSTAVHSSLRVSRDEIETTAKSRILKLGEERIALASLTDVLHGRGGDQESAVAAVVVLNHGGKLLALEVDAFEGEREAVRKTLGEFVSALDLVNGSAVIEGGRLVLFLHLAAVYRHAAGLQYAKTAKTQRGRRAKLLVVDDSELTRDMLVSILGRADFDVREAVDGLDALKALEQEKVDLVLTDLDMPALDGYGLVKRLREKAETVNLPVVVFSTRGSKRDKEAAMAAGANAYLVKAAFKEEEFVRTLRIYLGDG